MAKKKKKSIPLEDLLLNVPSQDDSNDFCIKGGIATSYTFNSNDPSMPYCKAHGVCKYKIENYCERPCCLFMHQKYYEEIK